MNHRVAALMLTLALSAAGVADAGPDAGLPSGLPSGLPEVGWQPLREVPVSRVVTPETYGATADDDADDTAAFADALAEARRSPGTAMRLRAGTYLLGDVGRLPLRLEQARDLIVRGEGAKLVIRSPGSGLFLSTRSERVILENFSVRHDPHPVVEATVAATDAGTGVLTLRPRDPALAGRLLQLGLHRAGFPIDHGVPGRLREALPNVYLFDSVTQREDGVVVATAKPNDRGAVGRLSVGDRFVLPTRVNAQALIRIERSGDVTVRGVITVSSSGAFVTSWLSTRVAVLDSHVRIPEGHWVSANADAVHVQSNRQGPWVEGCGFEGQGDDAMNVYTRPLSVKAVQGARTIAIGPDFAAAARVGDTFAALEPQSGQVVFRAAVASVEWDAVTLDTDLPSALIADLQAQPPKLQLYNEHLVGNFVIRGNTFRNSRRFGLFLKASHGIIEGNTFEGLSGEAITLHNEPSWPEGLFCRDVVIRGNVIEGCGFDGSVLSRKAGSAINVYAANAKYRRIDAKDAHDGIVIERNTIRASRLPAILVNSAARSRVTDNTIELPAGSAAETQKAIDAGDGVVLSGNRIGPTTKPR